MEHPAYDVFWQEQAVDKLLGKRPLTVPTMLTVGQWDQEDSYGAPAVYKALEAKDTDKPAQPCHRPVAALRRRRRRQQAGRASISPATRRCEFRTNVMKPFLDHYLKDGAPKAATPPVMTYATGINQWQQTPRWPAGKPMPLYLGANQGLGFDPARGGGARQLCLRSRQAGALRAAARASAGTRRLDDLAGRRSALCRRPARCASTTRRRRSTSRCTSPARRWSTCWAATSGTDSDWVVKLIDVYPRGEFGQPQAAPAISCPSASRSSAAATRRASRTPGPLTPGKPLQLQVRAAQCEPRLHAGPPNHGAGAVEPVPAL